MSTVGPKAANAHPADRCYDHDTYRRLLRAHGSSRERRDDIKEGFLGLVICLIT
ncbi:hypothetical protein ABTY96_07995 [Streptomyces sp. NPDC096057]|uniref:hypothetical protein n=1 Tax=Streptomyces sp. NPDC096057 TaxID=3155543 RepID=UPI003331F662